MKKMIVAIGLVGFASLVGVEVGMAQSRLEGLDSLHVQAFVTGYSGPNEVVGLTEDAVRTRAELELRRTGIAVSDSASVQLRVSILTVPFVDLGVGYHIDVVVSGLSLRVRDVVSFFEVHQDSMRYVITGEDLTQLVEMSYGATFWRVDFVDVVLHPDSAATNIMGAVSRALDFFLDDYLWVNPR